MLNVRAALTWRDAGTPVLCALSNVRHDSNPHTALSAAGCASLTSWFLFTTPSECQYFCDSQEKSNLGLASYFHTFLILQNQNWCQKYTRLLSLQWTCLFCYLLLPSFLHDNPSLEGSEGKKKKKKKDRLSPSFKRLKASFASNPPYDCILLFRYNW